jgi:uncharacterized protein (DUF1501 family)
MFAPHAPLDRRDFIALGGLALGACAFPAVAAPLTGKAPRRPARSCILVYLLGGPPHLDTFDLKPDAPAEVRGPFKPIATAVPGLRICEHLPRLAALARRYALVRTVSHNNHNHTPMIYYTLTGRMVERPNEDNDVRPPQRGDFPHLGAVMARLKGAPRDLPGYVAVPELATRSSIRGEYRRTRVPLRGGGAGFLGPLLDPLSVHDEPGAANAIPALAPPAHVTAERQQRRAALLTAVNRRGPAAPAAEALATLQRQAVVLSGARGGKTFALESEPPSTQDRYGRHRFGKALLLARRLAESGVPMTAVHFNEMTVCDGWDTHSKNFPALKDELLPMVDQSLSALLEDLAQRGLDEHTIVVVMGEFGRTPKINAAAGRDHWGLCQSVLLAGGGIKGGQVIGRSDRIGAYPADDAVDPVDIHATVYRAMGLAPDHHLPDNLGRPWPISTGKAIERLL